MRKMGLDGPTVRAAVEPLGMTLRFGFGGTSRGGFGVGNREFSCLVDLGGVTQTILRSRVERKSGR